MKLEKLSNILEIKNIVIHQLIKEANKRPVSNKQAEALLNVTEKEKMFMGRIHKSYYGKSSPVYGIFGDEDNSFKNLLESYIEEKDFYQFSVDVMHLYESRLRATISASGGFMLLCDYVSKKSKDYNLLVVMMNNKDGYMVKEDLTLSEVKNLDLSKVDVAALINISKWNAVRRGEDTESKSYLSFVKGLKKVSFYFMSFIDCSDKTTSSESTERLLNAIDDYLQNKEYSREDCIKKRTNLQYYCQECLAKKKEILLDNVSMIINPEEPEDFKKMASDENYKVSAIISGDKSKLKTLNTVIYKGSTFSITFDYNLLGDDIIFEKDESLTLKNLPLELKEKIRKALNKQ